jgi:inner membrane protein
MASAFTHAFAAVAIGKIASERARGWRFWVLAAGSAVLPDADVVTFAFGVDYGDLFGHRGFFHSLFFALIWSLFVVALEFRKQKDEFWRLTLLFFLFTASHPFLDAMTNGGLGVAFFAPFDNTRYFFPWRPIEVSPISVTRFFQEGGGLVLRTEFTYVWLPLISVWLCVWTGRRVLDAAHAGSRPNESTLPDETV